jgi:hypothetical protein
MATLVPDYAHKLFEEEDVTPPAGVRPNDAYDLALYQEKGKPDRGVLVVKIVLQFQFRDGESQLPRTRGRTLHWRGAEKITFARKCKDACYNVWNDRHRITTTSQTPAVKDIGVQFDIQNLIEGWHVSDHWEIVVTKADDWMQSGTQTSGWSWDRGVCVAGNAYLDSLDTNFDRIGTSQQRGAPHEFGHLLGLRDEYPAAPDCARTWTGDADSIMHSGEQVRARHYAMFAAWITEQFADAAHLAREPVTFKVGGTVDVHNAHL